MQKSTSDADSAALSASLTRTATINMLASVLSAILIGVFGYMLTGRLELALKERQAGVQERQATVQALEKMSEFLTQINNEKINEEERDRTILRVVMYGSDAIYPLFVMAVSQNAYSPSTAIRGLRLLAVQHRMQICELLLSAQEIPKTVNSIRKTAIDTFTVEELKCAKQEQKG
jgi:hypothetical protein